MTSSWSFRNHGAPPPSFSRHDFELDPHDFELVMCEPRRSSASSSGHDFELVMPEPRRRRL